MTFIAAHQPIVHFSSRIGRTTPHLNIFASFQETLTFTRSDLTALNASTATLGEAFGLSQIVGDLAVIRAQKAAEHVSTPGVARGTLGIVKAYGDDKLQYWGFS